MKDRRTLIVVSVFLGLAVLGLLVALFTGGTVPYQSSSLSRSLVGHRAVVELLRKNGFQITINRHEQPRRDGEEGLAVFAPTPDEDKPVDSSWRRLTDRFRPQLVVLPKWMGQRHPRKKHWILIEGRYDASKIDSVLPDGDAWDVGYEPVSGEEGQEDEGETHTVRSDRTGASYSVRTRGLQFFKNEDAGTVLWRVDDRPVVMRDRRTDRVWVSDPDLVSNMYLGRANNAGFAISLFQEVFPQQTFIVDEQFRGFDIQESLLELLFTFPGLILTLNVTFLMLCFYWWLHRSWSGRRKANEEERSRLEQADAMGRLTHAHGDHAHAGRLYVSNLQTRIAETISLSQDADWKGIVERLDSLRPDLADQLRALKEDLGRLKEPEPDEQTIVRIARQVNHIYDQLHHGLRQGTEGSATNGN